MCLQEIKKHIRATTTKKMLNVCSFFSIEPGEGGNFSLELIQIRVIHIE